MDWIERKKIRTEKYQKNHGKKLIKCIACNGSGYYDTTINGKIPKCSSCMGTGLEREK
jgi:DnaJ-class molecular chaperone